MNKLKECPECGSKEIKQGKLFGEAKMYPINAKLYIGGSEIIADICSKFGYIISGKVKNPEEI